MIFTRFFANLKRWLFSSIFWMEFLSVRRWFWNNEGLDSFWIYMADENFESS